MSVMNAHKKIGCLPVFEISCGQTSDSLILHTQAHTDTHTSNYMISDNNNKEKDKNLQTDKTEEKSAIA